MACLGVHFALTHEQVEKLRSFNNDSDRLDFLQEEIEEKFWNEHREYGAETDKSWDAMHRLLSNGDLSYADGSEPLRFTVIGGEPLYLQEDYIISLKTPEQVKAVSAAINDIDQEEFRAKYDQMDEGKYGFSKSDDDFEYTWSWFTGVVELYQKAAQENLYVVFTADQ